MNVTSSADSESIKYFWGWNLHCSLKAKIISSHFHQCTRWNKWTCTAELRTHFICTLQSGELF